MRCRTCDYSLWKTTARTCPECGAPFRPSEFEFRPGAVRFGCPHCDQEYYGTAADGHLEPTAFQCVRCQRPISMDEMVLAPAKGFDETSAERPPNPWTERARIGFWRGWFRTVRSVLFAPALLARSLAPNESLWQPIWFVLITAFLTSMLGVVVSAGMFIALAALAGPGAGAMPIGVMLGQQALFTVVGIFFGIGMTIVWCLISHVLLRVMGGAREGWRTSLRALLYAIGGTNALNLAACVPCIGIAALVWWIVSGTIMLREVQRTNTARAVTAVVVPSAVTALAAVALVAIMIGWVVTVAPPPGGPLARPGPPPIAQQAAADGAWPRTPLDAVAAGMLGGGELLDMVAPGDPEARIEGLSRDDLDFGPRSPVRLTADLLARRVPASGPYRIGDLVVVWPGVDPATTGGWIMIALEGNQYRVINAAGGFGPLPMSTFDDLLAAENNRRSAFGEPIIPPLADIPVVPLAP